MLDDVLIGLDMSDRMPVLDILRQRFADWRIILLTHDKGVVRNRPNANRIDSGLALP